MARLFDDASSEYLENTISAPVTDAPLTLACWARLDFENQAHALVSVQDKDSPNNWFILRAKNVDQLLYANFWVRSSVALPEATSTASFAINEWYHLCAIEYSTSSRAVLLDGGSKGTNATACTPTGMDSVSIGRIGDSTPDGYTSGRIAEAAIWNVALTDAEVAILAKGYSPLLVRPQNLVAYWPLIRDEDQDRVGGYNLTAVNTPTIAAHPRVLYPAPPMAIAVPIAATMIRIPRYGFTNFQVPGIVC